MSEAQEMEHIPTWLVMRAFARPEILGKNFEAQITEKEDFACEEK